MKTALITGAAGFLGSHLCDALLSEGLKVIGVDNLSTGSKENLAHLATNKDFVFFKADVSASWADWTNQVPQDFSQDIQYVFHFASAASPIHYKSMSLETMWVNSVGLGKAIDFANQFGARLVFASTSEVYGDPLVHPQPESYWGNVNSFGERSCYDEAKRFGEALIYSSNLRDKSRHGIVRIFNTYGPRMNLNDGRVVINFLKQAKENKNLTIFGSGEQTRTFCYVSDLITGVLAYAKSNICEPLNIGGQEELSILEVAQRAQKIFKCSSEVVHLPLSKDDPQQRKPDLTKSLQLLSPWQPKINFDEGLRKMADWLCL